jgi:glutathione synthase/RimK-type ligase-like ATP-grasp enzyme
MDYIMSNPVLIFSMHHDAHAQAAKWALKRNDIPAVISDSVYLNDETQLSVSINGIEDKIEIVGNDIAKPRCVWCRRPSPPKIIDCLEADKEFINGQWRFFQKNIFDLSDDVLNALWVNRPAAASYAESKLAQLRAARSAGLMIPETIISNSASHVNALIERWGRIVFKTFYPQSWHNESSGRTFSMSAVQLNRGDDISEQSIEACPGIYQRYIEKSFDIRATVMGNKIFAVKIMSANEGAYFDWRHHVYESSMRMEGFFVTAALEKTLHDVMSRLGIVFGCFDLVMGKNGELYFLEVNQAGQFLFLEQQMPELHLLQAMTSMLKTGRCDYNVDDSISLNLSEYLASDEYLSITVPKDNPGRSVATE